MSSLSSPSGLPEAFWVGDLWFWSTADASRCYATLADPNIELTIVNDVLLFNHGFRRKNYTPMAQAWMLWVIARNPAFDLLCLEDPSLPRRFVGVYAQGLHDYMFEHQWPIPRRRLAVPVDNQQKHLIQTIWSNYGKIPMVQEIFREIWGFAWFGSHHRILVPLAPQLEAIQFPDLLAVLFPDENSVSTPRFPLRLR